MSDKILRDSIPEHVDPDLVRNFDYLDLAPGLDSYLEWRRVQTEYPDIFYTPCNGGHWVATRYADIDHIVRTYTDFSSREMMIPRAGRVLGMPPNDLDPPEQTSFRKLIASFFAPAAIGNLEGKARKLAISLIDEFKDRGECEFIEEFALRLPVGIFMSLVDLQECDRLDLVSMSEEIVRSKDPAIRRRGFQRVYDYLSGIVEERRKNPGDDIISAMLVGEVEDGRKLTTEEALGMGSVLLLGGLDTITASLGLWANFLAGSPEHRRQLIANPELVIPAVEELLRRFQTSNFARLATGDFEYAGVTFRAGDMILVSMPCSGLDERQYPDALLVDFDRKNKKSHIFGRGAHQCLGAFLARTELRIFLEEWLKRIPDFTVKPGFTPEIGRGQNDSIRTLHLVWERGK